MMLGLVQLLVGFVVAWEAVELVLRHGLLLSVFKLAILAALAAAAGCVAIIFFARAVAWVLQRAAKLSIGCRSYGFNYLRDITISSPKGAVESICIGEIRLGLRKPITQLGFTVLTHGPILQLQISDLDVVLRQPVKSTNKKKPAPRKPISTTTAKAKGKSKGQVKWRLITSMASLLSLSIVELRLKAPKAALGIKDLKTDISKTGGLDPVLNVQVNIIPLFVQALDSDSIGNNTLVFSKLDWWVSGQYCSAMDTSDHSSFLFEDISLSCDLHQRDKAIRVKNLDLMLGPIVVNLEEKLLAKKKPSASTVAEQKDEPSVDNKSAARSEGGKLASLNKKISMFPEKVSFNMSKLVLKFLPKDHGLSINNEIGSISLRCTRLQPQDFGEVTTHIRLETDVTEIHLLMDGATSVLEVVKVSTVVSANIPSQPALPVQAEVDIKISGFQCNLIVSRIKPLIRINSDKKKPLVLHENPQQKKAPKEKLALSLACTMSVPELTLVLHSLDDVPLYHCIFQSANVSASKMIDRGTQLHGKLGDLKFLVPSKHQQSMKEGASGTLLHISHSTLDLEQNDPGQDNDEDHAKSAISVNISGIRMHFCFSYLESLCATAMSYKVFMKSILPPKKRSVQENASQKSTKKAKRALLLKINVAQCSIVYDGEMRLEDMSIADPKRVNFGSQGGRVVIINEANGSPRMAYVNSTSLPDHKNVHFSTSLEIYQFGVSLNKAKHTMQVELENFRLTHKEDQLDNKPVEETKLFDVRKAKFVQRSGGLNDIAACSLINVTDIAVRWEPDPYLELLEVATRLKSVLHRMKLQNSVTEVKDETLNMDILSKKESPSDHGQQEKAQKKRESVIAIDLESLKISGELADGVEAMITVGYIFSENAKIGVLVEGISVSFCGAWILKSSRMQLSRIPISVSDSNSDKKLQSAAACDWVIQCRDVNICLPFRLQLRAIDDAVEDTLRAFKLISAAKTSVLFPEKKSSTTSSKKSKPKSTAFRYVRIIVRDLIAEIEEEPMQGWLDEHMILMKNVFCESTVRLNLLDELSSGKNKDSPKAKLDSSEKNSGCPDVDAYVPGTHSIEKLREEIYRQAFQSYYQACQKLPVSEGSGACSSGFQSGFKMSTRRASVMSVCAKDVDVSLSKIDGGDEGMISFIKSLDPVCDKDDIPFSRLYGSNFSLKTRSLSAYLRDYTFPLFSGTNGKCDGRLVLGQQATCFQPQARQDVYVGKWWRVNLLRSATGYTPPMKTYADIPLYFKKAEVSFGVGYEPVFADVSYAFTCALRRANLAKRWYFERPEPPRRERSLPWWDDMRNYIHGKFKLCFNETKWHLPASTSPYEKLDELLIITDFMEIHYVDGYVSLSSKYLRVYLTSLESLAKKSSLEIPHHPAIPFLETPSFFMDISIEWGCDSGNPMDHFIFALPAEGKPRDKVFDAFRSTSLSLKWSFSLKPYTTEPIEHQKKSNLNTTAPTVNVGVHDLAWLMKWWNLVFLPPHKLRLFSRFPRFGVPRFVRSGNLPLDRVMTEQCIRFDAMQLQINNMPLQADDPAKGLTLHFTKFRYEIAFSRGKQIFTFDCKREPLDLVYQGIDLHLLKVFINRIPESSTSMDSKIENKVLQTKDKDSLGCEKGKKKTSPTEKSRDDGFFLYSDYFTIRKQTPKADAARLSAWQEDGRKKTEMPLIKSEFDGGDESDHDQSGSDDEGFNVVVADSCQRVFVYGLKILWNLENRAAVLSWVGGLTQAFQPPKPSPSRQYTQTKILEKKQLIKEAEMSKDGALSSVSSTSQPSEPQQIKSSESPPSNGSGKPDLTSSSENALKRSNNSDSEEEGTRHFMVNVVQPQFNLHSEEANGRFLLAAGSGRVMVRSFHSIVQVGQEMFEKAIGSSNDATGGTGPEMTWSRVELSVMLEHVQAHVAPTDVDPGAGIQWLPKIHRRSSEVKRTGALLERVFMPCQMYFRYTRHKGGTPELKVKPLKELTFNSPDITAGMTSRQFQVMMDVLTNLLFARTPKKPKSNLSYPLDNDDDNIEEASDAVVPDGVEEVVLAKIGVEVKERARKLLLDDIRALSICGETSHGQSQSPKANDIAWIVTGSRLMLVKQLKKRLVNVRNGRKEAYSMLRTAMQKAAQLRLMEKEKNKSPSFAMRISVRIKKIVWSMLADGKSFSEAEINDMIFEFDRDYKDIGIAQLTTKLFVLKNGLANAKSDTVVSPWNPPAEWGNKQKRAKNTVDIYPLKIYLTEAMYRMMWGYFFPGDEQQPQKRQELFKVSTTAGTRRKKNTSVAETNSPNNQSSKETTFAQKPELRRTSSFDRTWEETVAESVANELVSQMEGQTNTQYEPQDAAKDSKLLRPVRSTREDKKIVEPNELKQSRPQKMMDFRNIKISQVELQLTYEGLPFAVSDVRLLMDTFHREDFTGTWARLFSRVKKHIVWGVLKSVTGMQATYNAKLDVNGKKFKAKSSSQKEPSTALISAADFNLSDSDGDEAGSSDQLPAFLKKPSDGAGDGFATSVKGLFSTQKKKAMAFVLKTMKGDADHDFHGERSENEIEFSPFARQLTITKTKKLIRRHTKKLNKSKVHKVTATELEVAELPPRAPGYNTDSSSDSSSAETSPKD
ncbi:Protein ABERRANT POLLEN TRANSMISSION 1 [Zea mays]|uniref:Protein ABERRANT POLLEN TRANSMISSION 1 n=2 Tax=Zea mays TaxID=4577 RepID=A0A3L6DB56_MAIZE|nr:aberrant pollen transmission1 [Zea mays]PWZ05307.1 Protein ABERRANT POLLEN TRANSMISSION 1 [Zea mays]